MHYTQKIIQPYGRTKEGIFPIVKKGCFSAWLLQKNIVENKAGVQSEEHVPLAFELIGRRASRARGTADDSFEVGFYDLGGLWKIIQDAGVMLGGNQTSLRFYGIGEQKKLPEANRWKVEKSPCVAWGLEVKANNSTIRDNLFCHGEWDVISKRNLSLIKWFPSEEARDTFKLPNGIVLAEKHFQPSLYEKWLCTAPDLNEGGYVYANTSEKARAFFRQSLAKKQIPCPIEWETPLWDAFVSKGWLSELVGHRMAGFKIINDRDETLDLIGDMVENSFGANPGHNKKLPILPKFW